MRPINTKTYIFTLLITVVIFMFAFIISSYLTDKKTEQLKADEDKIAINILSLETQYDLLKESSCKTFNRGALRQELDSLLSRLQYIENQVGDTNPEVFRLKRYYSILEIKDYLITQKMSAQCNLNTVFILYFYSNKNCSRCQNQEYLLRAIRERYSQVEIYSFDYNLDLNAVRTLTTLHNIPPEPPIIDINGTVYSPFESLEAITSVIEPLVNKATTTKSTLIQSAVKK